MKFLSNVVTLNLDRLAIRNQKILNDSKLQQISAFENPWVKSALNAKNILLLGKFQTILKLDLTYLT